MRYNAPVLKEIYWKEMAYQKGDIIHNLSYPDYKILVSAGCISQVAEEVLETQMTGPPENRIMPKGRARR
jgi:hypothetical protein